jgi:hypothetical protein
MDHRRAACDWPRNQDAFTNLQHGLRHRATQPPGDLGRASDPNRVAPVEGSQRRTGAVHQHVRSLENTNTRPPLRTTQK